MVLLIAVDTGGDESSISFLVVYVSERNLEKLVVKKRIGFVKQ